MLGSLRPTYYYGKQHDYVYYPESWTDETSGKSYEKGYYDENGQYYASVSCPKDGTYENVICHCPYCEQDTILNLTTEAAGSHHLQCPHCGGPMEIQSELEEYLNPAAENTHVYQSEESLRKFTANKPKKKKRRWIIAAAVLAVLLCIGSAVEDSGEYGYSNGQSIQQIHSIESDTSGFGSEIRLVSNGQNSYSYASANSQTFDKRLVWDRDADSYYDADSDCWLWYNTDVSPAIWQYWYEGISSDYGDFGWMEHDTNGWYIEQSEGSWIELPDRYSSSDLWYISE